MHFSLKEKVVTANLSRGLYIVSKIAPGFNEYALAVEDTPESNHENNSADLSENKGDNKFIDDGEDLNRNERMRWNKYHRRFGHFGIGKLRYLHEFTNLKKAIKEPSQIEICHICIIAKLLNKKRKILDNATRRKWVLLLKTRDETKEKLTKWRKKVELEKSSQGYKIKAVRSDNAGEIKSIVDNWAVTDGIKSESTASYSSHQNGAAERTFRTTEECKRAKLEDAKMLIEFWDEAVEATVYERNHIDLGPPTKKGKRQ
ncbi:hypothetical protein K3495_g8917 [Podosphaera aphanis]|nr:hypothetical protein K3495_g8917 [Podosphaera aphanis]